MPRVITNPEDEEIITLPTIAESWRVPTEAIEESVTEAIDQLGPFVGTDGTTAGQAGLVPAPATTDADKYLKSDGTWGEGGASAVLYDTTGQNTDGAMTQKATTDALGEKQDALTAGDNMSISPDNVISATDTTYEDFTGTDGTTAGAAGLVPAPATTDADKFLKADGTWAEAGGGGGPEVVQVPGTSTTDVMSQKAASNLVYPTGHEATGDSINIGVHTKTLGSYGVLLNPREDSGNIQGTSHSSIAIGARLNITNSGPNVIVIGSSAEAGLGLLGNSTGSIAIGYQSSVVGGVGAVAIGGGKGDNYKTVASHEDSVALGSGSKTGGNNEISVGRGAVSGGGPATRRIANVTDPTNPQDAATKNYVDSIYPVGAVFTSTSSTAPTIAGGTWTEIGTQTVGSSTVHYYERTA